MSCNHSLIPSSQLPYICQICVYRGRGWVQRYLTSKMLQFICFWIPIFSPAPSPSSDCRGRNPCSTLLTRTLALWHSVDDGWTDSDRPSTSWRWRACVTPGSWMLTPLCVTWRGAILLSMNTPSCSDQLVKRLLARAKTTELDLVYSWFACMPFYCVH